MDVAPNTDLTVQHWVTECLWHLTNGVYSTLNNCPWFSQALCICTSMAPGSCMNNITVKWLGSYLSQLLNFTSQHLQGDFIWCLNSTGSVGGGRIKQDPKKKTTLHRDEPCESSTVWRVQADLGVMPPAEPPLWLWWRNPHNSFNLHKRLSLLMQHLNSYSISPWPLWLQIPLFAAAFMTSEATLMKMCTCSCCKQTTPSNMQSSEDDRRPAHTWLMNVRAEVSRLWNCRLWIPQRQHCIGLIGKERLI